MSTQVLRLARKTTVSLETTLEGILLNEIPLSNMDYTVKKKFHQWTNNTLLLWCGKVSECINLTALDNQIKSLADALNFSSFSIDKIISNNRLLMTISIISPDEKTLSFLYDKYHAEILNLCRPIPIAARSIVVSELNYYEFEAKLILFF